MRYFGGKARISKPLAKFLNSELECGQPFVDMFCGSCNIVSKIDPNRARIANDAHKYLISMWKHVIEGGSLPNIVTKEDYYAIKDEGEDWLRGFVGFGCSFAGKWWGGYARGRSRNYCINAKNSILKKLEGLQGVSFTNYDYSKCPVPGQSLIYCDIPYKDSTPYCKNEVGVFDHENFYKWCIEMEKHGHRVYVSEYSKNVPKGATAVWSKESRKDIRNREGVQTKTEEVVFRFI